MKELLALIILAASLAMCVALEVTPVLSVSVEAPGTVTYWVPPAPCPPGQVYCYRPPWRPYPYSCHPYNPFYPYYQQHPGVVW